MTTHRARWVVVFGLLVLTPKIAEAQVLIALLFGDKLSTERFQLGINVSFALTGFSGVENHRQRSWALGAYGEIALTDHLHLQPEFVFKTPAGAKELDPGVRGYPFEPTGDDAIDELIQDGSVTRELKYVSLPIFLKWVGGPIGIGLGPEIRVMTNGEDTVSKSTDRGRLSLEDSVEGAQRFDAGIAGSLEYAFQPEKKMRSMRIRTKGYYGLVDTIKEGSGKAIRNWNFMAGLDIPIGG